MEIKINETKPLIIEAMKKITSTILIALLAGTMICLAADRNEMREVRKVVPITLKEAVQIPGLVIAMYQQLNPSILNNNQHFYVLRVNYGLNIYEISGTYDQWIRFFSMRWKCPVKTKKPAVAS
jgi:hypothetical protein